MNLKKIKELRYIDTDIYLFHCAQQNLYVNTSDASVGTFNIDLEMIQEIQFSQDIYMYDIFVEKNHAKYAIYDPEVNCLFFGNIDSKKSIKIPLPKNFPGTLSHVYDWSSEKLVIDTYGSSCIEVLPDGRACVISIEKIASDHPSFYQFVKRIYSDDHDKYQIQYQDRSFIDINNGVATFHSLVTQDATSVIIGQTEYHDLIYRNGFFVFISESHITIKTTTQFIVVEKDHDTDYLLRAALTESNNQLFLFILVGDKSSQFTNRIVKYELQI